MISALSTRTSLYAIIVFFDIIVPQYSSIGALKSALLLRNRNVMFGDGDEGDEGEETGEGSAALYLCSGCYCPALEIAMV